MENDLLNEDSNKMQKNLLQTKIKNGVSLNIWITWRIYYSLRKCAVKMCMAKPNVTSIETIFRGKVNINLNLATHFVL